MCNFDCFNLETDILKKYELACYLFVLKLKDMHLLCNDEQKLESFSESTVQWIYFFEIQSKY